MKRHILGQQILLLLKTVTCILVFIIPLLSILCSLLTIICFHKEYIIYIVLTLARRILCYINNRIFSLNNRVLTFIYGIAIICSIWLLLPISLHKYTNNSTIQTFEFFLGFCYCKQYCYEHFCPCFYIW